MATLLQTLLIETLAEDTDPILRSFVETLLPSVEREFGDMTALGGSEEAHFENLKKTMDEEKARQTARKFASKADQSLLVHVLNALLIAWNLQKYLPSELNNIEKHLLCLGMVLHDYDKAERGQKEDSKEPPKANEIPRILEVCRQWADRLNFEAFFPTWRNYLLEIAYLAQNTQFNRGSNPIASNWEIGDLEFQIDFDRLNSPLCSLLAFGDIAVHMNDPLDLTTVREGNKNRTTGDALREHLELLEIDKKLVYHRLRDCRGLITNQIHNAVVSFASNCGWEPILFFAQGAVYLASKDTIAIQSSDVHESTWTNVSNLLTDKILNDGTGIKRGKDGISIAPETLSFLLEMRTNSELVKELPYLVRTISSVYKAPNYLQEFINRKVISRDRGDELVQRLNRAVDWIAEFIAFVQSRFFEKSQIFPQMILEILSVQPELHLDIFKDRFKGVNYKLPYWYFIATCYIEFNSTSSEDDLFNSLIHIANQIAIWAEEKSLFKNKTPKVKLNFLEYIQKYLEISGHQGILSNFASELENYSLSKNDNKPICSLSSGEFSSEEQLESVVLFQQQAFSNKNSLGNSSKLKRRISTVWVLEMLLRKSLWSTPTYKIQRGKKFEDQQPIFLYIYPAYVYSPQVARAIKLLVKGLQRRTNLWNAREEWQKSGMKTESLQMLAWQDSDEVEVGRRANLKYSEIDLPFLAVTHTTTKGETVTDAWIEPAFLSLALPKLLGVKVVATSSSTPLYASDKEFLETVKLDGAAGFWNLLGLPASLRLQDIEGALQRLLVMYSLHLDNRSKKLDPKWHDLIKTVREVMTNVLNIFGIANEGLRKNKRERPTDEEVFRYWDYAQVWSKGNHDAEEKMKFTEQLVKHYRAFYQVSLSESTHTILMPLSKAMEIVLSSPNNTDSEDLILQGSGQLHDALDRQEVFKRPFLMNKEVEFPIRKANEMLAIQEFMSFFVNDVFGKQFKGDRALLQENRNRIKSGAEFAYRMQSLQDKQATQAEKAQSEELSNH